MHTHKLAGTLGALASRGQAGTAHVRIAWFLSALVHTSPGVTHATFPTAVYSLAHHSAECSRMHSENKSQTSVAA